MANVRCTLLVVMAIALSTSAHAQLGLLKPPEKSFAEETPPPQPDYTRAEAWLVYPGRPSKADVVPRGISGGKPSAPQADVFFIHPTTYLANSTWNARFDEGGVTATQLEDGVLRYQTSIFNGCCRIFAPRYRQTTISAFLSPGDDSNKAFDLSFSDVLRAFDHFIANDNKGRPFILASHSQGSLHATRLLQERIVGNPELRRRLVVAYVVGASLPGTIEWTGLAVCNSASQIRCIVDWNSVTALTPLALGRGLMVTYGEKRYQPVGRKTWLCVNPLTWDRSGVAAASANRGALANVGHGNELKPLVTEVTGAKCVRGRLVVSLARAKREGFIDPLTKLGSYHNHDYNLFYSSVRQNAIQRVNAFVRTAK